MFREIVKCFKKCIFPVIVAHILRVHSYVHVISTYGTPLFCACVAVQSDHSTTHGSKQQDVSSSVPETTALRCLMRSVEK